MYLHIEQLIDIVKALVAEAYRVEYNSLDGDARCIYCNYVSPHLDRHMRHSGTCPVLSAELWLQSIGEDEDE